MGASTRLPELGAVLFVCLLTACATAGPAGNGDGGDDIDGNNGSDGPGPIDARPDGTPIDGPPIDAPIDAPSTQTITLSQSSSTAITALNSVACSDNLTGYTRENSYYRVFRLADFGVNTAFTAQRVDVGIEDAEPGGSSQSFTVRLHTLNGAFLTANLTPIAGQVVTAPVTTTGLVMPVALSPAGVAPAGSTLVVEILVPDGYAAGNIFFIGSNTATESGPSYIRAPDCGLNEPGTFASVGFANVHIILTVTGTY